MTQPIKSEKNPIAHLDLLKKQTGIDQLKESCRYLINQRGFEEWKM